MDEQGLVFGVVEGFVLKRAWRLALLREPKANVNGHANGVASKQNAHVNSQSTDEGRIERLIAYLSAELQTAMELSSPPDSRTDLADQGMDSLAAWKCKTASTPSFSRNRLWPATLCSNMQERFAGKGGKDGHGG